MSARDARSNRRRARRAALQGELERVLRLDVALLLEEAALLRARYAPFAAFLPERPRLLSPDAWRDGARLALACVPRARVRALLAICLAERRPSRWPRASRLARAAVALEPSARARLALAEAHLAEGDGARARAQLAALVQDEALLAHGRAWTGLGLAHESEGNDRLALAAFDRAGAAPDAGVDPLVGGLFLALALGDVRRARRACARLERLAARDAAAVDAGLARRAARVALLRPRARAPRATVELARELARGRRAAGRIAGLFLGDEA